MLPNLAPTTALWILTGLWVATLVVVGLEYRRGNKREQKLGEVDNLLEDVAGLADQQGALEEDVEELRQWMRDNLGPFVAVDEPATEILPTVEQEAVIERDLQRVLDASPATVQRAVDRELEIEAIRKRSAERNARRPVSPARDA